MGKTTGFLDYSRELAPRRPVLERVNDWFEIYQDFPEDTASQTGCALHGLRSSVLPDGMSRQQPDPRLERSRLSRSLERRCPPAARNRTISRSSRAVYVPRRAKPPAY